MPESGRPLFFQCPLLPFLASRGSGGFSLALPSFRFVIYSFLLIVARSKTPALFFFFSPQEVRDSLAALLHFIPPHPPRSPRPNQLRRGLSRVFPLTSLAFFFLFLGTPTPSNISLDFFAFASSCLCGPSDLNVPTMRDSQPELSSASFLSLHFSKYFFFPRHEPDVLELIPI